MLQSASQQVYEFCFFWLVLLSYLLLHTASFQMHTIFFNIEVTICSYQVNNQSTMPFAQLAEAKLASSLVFLLLLVLCSPKLFSHSFTTNNFRNNKGWNFLGRISAQPTQLAIEVRISVRSKEIKPQAVIDVQILAVPAQFWQEELDKKCDQALYDAAKLEKKTQQQISLRATITQQTAFSFTLQKQVQISEPITYNFVLRDCSQSFLKQGLSRQSALEIKLQVKNNQQHFTQNQFHNIWSLPLFIILTYLVLYVLKKDKDPEGDTWTKFMLKISIWTGIISISFKYADYLIYAYAYGRHFPVLDIMYLLLHAISDVGIIFIVLFVSYGWTITFTKHKKFDLWIPISLIVAFVYVVVTAVNKTRDGHHTKFHMFDTFAGYIMVSFRVLFYLIFVSGIIRSYLKLSSRHSKLKRFFLQFALFGTVYLTFLPIAMVLVEAVQEANRHEYMALGLETIRLLLNIWLAFLTGWRHSSYRQVVSNSFMEEDTQKQF